MSDKEIDKNVKKARELWENFLPEENLERFLKELRENLKEWDSVEAGLEEYRALLLDESRHHEELPKYAALAYLLGEARDLVGLAAWGNMEPASNGRREDVLITPTETQAFMYAAATDGPEEFDEIAKWVSYYEALVDAREPLIKHRRSYTTCIETLRIYAQSYYTLQEVDAYHHAIKELYPDDGSPARVEADKRLTQFVCTFSKIGPLSISTEEDDWAGKMAQELLVQVVKGANMANAHLCALKSAEKAIKDIVKKEKLEFLVPTDMRANFRDSEKQCEAGGFADDFLKNFIKSIAEFADLPTDGDERASLMTYKEAYVDPWAYKRVQENFEANRMIIFKNHLYDYEAHKNSF